MSAASITGGCLCGACRYSSTGEVVNVRACHCQRCQKATGAPLYARVLVPIDSVTMSGPIGWFDAGTPVRRGFCQRCGTSLFSERASIGGVGLTFGSSDEPDRFAPTEHIWVSAKQAWVKLDDGLPQHQEAPPA